MYTLRPATYADLDFLYGLHRDTLKDYVARTWGAWDDEQQAARFRANFDPARYRIIVVAGKDAGEISVELRETELWIASIEILPDYQRQGTGTEVIQDIVAEAAENTLPVGLQVLKVNPAITLYERLGFRVVAESATHFRMRLDWHA